jgi:DNA-binding NarL/FixJ family response regulator
MRSISAGARAYLDIQAGPEETREAIRVVLDGSIWATRRMLALLVDRLLNTPGVRVPEGPSEFSPREHQVMDLILRACSNREIAEELQIGERTVKGHVASLLRKTGTDNRVSLSVRVRQGLLYQRRFGEKE